MNNGIGERQNKDENINKLAAMRYLYSKAKFIFYIYLFSCVALSMVVYVCGNYKAEDSSITCLFLILKIVAVIIPCIGFTKIINMKKQLAALIQEEFDHNVLKTEWNENLYGIKGNHDYEIIINKQKYINNTNNEKWETDLINWYDEKYSCLPLAIGRVYCQATNICWDNELRLRFSKCILYIIYLISFVLLTVCIYCNYSFNYTIQYIILPCGSLLVLLRQMYIDNNDTIKKMDGLKSYLDLVLARKDSLELSNDEITKMSNNLQNKIYNYRKEAFLIPDRIYWIFKKEQEAVICEKAKLEKEKYDQMNNF